MSALGFVGLGLMGSAITTRLLEEGFVVRGYDVDPARRQQFEDAGGIACENLGEVVAGVDTVVLSLPHGRVVREVCLGPGGLASVAPAGLHVLDTTTASYAEVIATAQELERFGIEYLDVTVSGTSAMVAQRDLVAMVGGTVEQYDKVGPVVDAFSRSRHHVGPVGAATKTKLVVNLVVGSTRLVLAEALVLGEQGGLLLDPLMDVLKDSVGYSKVMDVYGDRLVNGDHSNPTGRLASHAKTIDLILDFGREVKAPLWMTTTLAQVLSAAKMEGLSDADSTATIEVLRRLAAAAQPVSR